MRKRFLILFLFTLVAFAADARLYMATQDVAVRKSRKGHAGTLGMIRKGMTIDVDETSGPGDDEWARVLYHGHDGFVKSKFLVLAPEVPSTPAPEVHKRWSLAEVILFLAAIAISIMVVRKLVGATEKYLKQQYPSKSKRDVTQKSTHWYQCKQCRILVKNSILPSIKGCVKGELHSWTELGEVGLHKYFCKHCATSISAKAVPVMDGCPEHDFHYWTQLP